MSDVPAASLTSLTILVIALGLAPGVAAQHSMTDASGSIPLRPRLEEGPAPARTSLPRYEHERVLPFSFAYPDDWEVWESPLGWSSRHWLIAAPRGTGAQPSEATDGALVVTLRGYQPEFFFAPDPLARAVALATDTLRRRPRGRDAGVLASEEIRLGETPARIIPYSLPAADGLPAQSGLLLVAVRGLSLLRAEVHWAADDQKAEATARTLLGSFRVPQAAAWKEQKAPAEGEAEVLLRHPEDWTFERIRTADASLAFKLESPRGRELLLRRLPLKDDLILDDTRCRALARNLLVDQLGMVSAEDIADAAAISWPGTSGGLRILAEYQGSLRDTRLFARRGEIVVGILEVADSRGGPEFGTALKILASFRAAKSSGLAVPRLNAKNFFSRPTSFAVGDLDLFDGAGRPRATESTRLRAAPDGSFRLFPTGLGLKAPTRGRYRIQAGSLVLQHADGSITLTLDPSFQSLTPPSGAPLYRVPDLP
jgi:hypothetical protein